MEREEKKEIVVKERENILILFPCLNITLMNDRQKSTKKWVEFKKMSRGGIFFLGGHNIYSCRTY